MQEERKILFVSFRKYWHLIALTIGLSLFTAVFEGLSIGMLIPFLQNLSSDASDVFQTGVAWVDQYILGVDGSKLERMYRICGVILVATWMRSIFGYIGGWYSVTMRARIVEDFRMRVVDQLQAVALRFYSTTRSGEIINTFMSEMERMVALISVLTGVLKQGMLLVVYVSIMTWISWELTLGVMIFFSVLALSMTRLIASIRSHGEDITEANGHFTASVSEFIDGIRTVTAYNMQAFERERLHKAAHGIAQAMIRTTKRSLVVQPLSQAVVSTVLLGVVVAAVQFLVLPGQLDIAFLLTFLFAMFRLMPAVHQLNSKRSEWAQNRAALDNVANLLRRDNKPYLEDGAREAQPLQERLTFQNVSFSYQPGQPVLKNIDVHIPRGKMTALVGATGAGKSTLADLVPRFYDPTAGSILYDGIDLRDFKVKSLRARIAVVSQSTHVFNDTVRANIAYGDPEASFERVVQVAEQANALGFIEKMDEDFDTILGERGVRLSGGQRQRLAIARALLRDPEILILDEATSALDSATEKLVQESLDSLMQGRTVIAIAHRLSTIENADQVLVLEDGRIVEQGPYQELLKHKGQLWEYHSIQYQMA